jgi:flavin prenyltransferase
MKLIIGITGATGAIYGIRLLQILHDMKGIETHVVVSRAGEKTIEYETDFKISDIKALANFNYDIDNIGASLASGSFKRDGMIIAPCSMKTLAALANSYADNLITRAADVTLKEREKLLLLVRETPLHLGHLRNMTNITEVGAIVMPPVPAFYFKPRTLEDIINHTVGKALDVFNIEHNLFPRWSGTKEQ